MAHGFPKINAHDVLVLELLQRTLDISPLKPANEELVKFILNTLFRMKMKPEDAIQAAEELSIVPTRFSYSQQPELVKITDDVIADLRARTEEKEPLSEEHHKRLGIPRLSAS